MSSGVNKAILIGNLGADPEIRYTGGGVAVANFNIAVTESYKKKDGEREEKTEWLKIVAFGKLAEICGEHLKKGSRVYLEGRIQTDKWEDKEGNTRYTTSIIANQMRMLGGKAEAKEEPPRDDGHGNSDENDDAPF